MSKMIDCNLMFELALCGHDESVCSDQGAFTGLMDVEALLDSAVQEHLQSVTLYKGVFETAQKELLDCMLSVFREHITEKIRSAVLFMSFFKPKCQTFTVSSFVIGNFWLLFFLSLMTVNE